MATCPKHGESPGDPTCPGVECNGKSPACRKPGEVLFGTLHPDGQLTGVRTIRQSDIRRCPHLILSATHYREDGTCRCDDPAEQRRLIRTCGYKRSDFPSKKR